MPAPPYECLQIPSAASAPRGGCNALGRVRLTGCRAAVRPTDARRGCIVRDHAQSELPPPPPPFPLPTARSNASHMASSRLRHAPQDHVLAQEVFDALREAWSAFQHEL